MLRIILLMIVMAVSTHARGYAQAAAISPPGCAAPEYRQFDFWLGDWDTYESSASLVSIARAHVELIAAGCALHELYEQTDGLVGDSILSFDPGRKLWQQTWVTNRGALMVIEGESKDSALTLEGEMHLSDGRVFRQRIMWKVVQAGVRETSLISKDGGKTWESAFDVFFRKHSATAVPK